MQHIRNKLYSEFKYKYQSKLFAGNVSAVSPMFKYEDRIFWPVYRTINNRLYEKNEAGRI